MTGGTANKGGFHFGNVGGNVDVHAGGDVVGGDKTTTTTVESGFQSELSRQEFLRQIEALREGLREIKAQVEAQAALSADDKDALAADILARVQALRDVKVAAAEATASLPAPEELTTRVKSTLDETGSLLDRVKSVAEKTVGMTGSLAALIAQYGPLLVSARHLFGFAD